eukprot:GHVP01060023.1.p1 GENE.GHVP01060023.1~~GHVP01060023.1.p1  ORF type:complete len:126 (+),score=21.28 GHVP01060023.1:725-1102(+)
MQGKMEPINNPMAALKEVLSGLRDSIVCYNEKTDVRLRVIDAYICFEAILGLLAVLAATVFGSFPYNSVLGAVFCTIGNSVLGGTVRTALTLGGGFPAKMKGEIVVAQFALAAFILHGLAFLFIG